MIAGKKALKNIFAFISIWLVMFFVLSCKANPTKSSSIEKQINDSIPYNRIIIQYNSDNYRRLIFSNIEENSQSYQNVKAKNGFLMISNNDEKIFFNLDNATNISIDSSELKIEYD